MRRTAATQVDLERVRRPRAVTANRGEVDCRAPDHAFTREPSADLQRLGRDERRVFGIGRKVAAEVDLAVRSAEHLVMRRHDVHLPGRAHAELDAWTPEVVAFDALLDDAALPVERAEIALEVGFLVLERYRAVKVAPRGLEVDQRITEPAHALVELHDGNPRVGATHAELVEGPSEVVRPPQVETCRVADGLVREDAPAARLRAEPAESRVAAVDRQLESLGQPDLVLRHAERYDHGHLGLADEPLDPFDRARPREELAGQRLVARVDQRHRLEPASRLCRVELG